MKAVAVFPKTREIRLIERPPPPRPTGTQVVLRVLEVGICGTDREIAAFEYGIPPPESDHLILGHEALAEVVDVGPEVTLVRPGELVVPTVRRPCPHARCRACRAGRQDFCVTGDFRERGIKEIHGFLQEHVLEDQENLIRVPRALVEVAVLTEPLAVAAKAMEQAEGIQARLPWERTGQRALVLGGGPVGLLGAMELVVNEFDTYVYSLEPATSGRAALTRSFGGKYLSGQDIPVGELPKKLGPVDLVYEAVGVSRVAFAALGTLGPNGVFIFTGVPALREPSLVDTDGLMRQMVLQNQVVFGSVNASRTALQLAVRGLEQCVLRFADSVRALITARRTLEEAPQTVMQRTGLKEVIHLAAPSWA